jgi:[protein-PII] uridylyltransferase
VRSRPQHNPYHRFTVDRHLLETAANAAGLGTRVARPDLLLLGALLHDVGKGAPGDHSEAGVAIARIVVERMGFSPEDVEVVAALVGQHLLLPEVASRRDIDDPATIERVAAAVPSVEVLHLLAALTEADARATGPAAWTPWRAGLVAALVERVERQLGGAPWPGGGADRSGLDPLTRLPGGRRCLEASGNVLRVVTEDFPGVFSRVAGVLSLHGLDVVAASATSDDDGWARSEFQVVDPVRDAPPWARVIDTLERALDGRLALAARLAERRRTYERPRPFSRVLGPARVRFDVEASARATVIDVHAPDCVGALYAVTRALAELDLDIRSARVQTMGAEVVDAFYVRDRHGGRIDDPTTRAEIERAILHALPG